MENIRGQEEFGDTSLVFVEFEPPSGWTEDPTSYHLLVDLPEFKTNEVKLQVDSQDQISISGERKVTENKYARFEQKFRVPGDSDIANITGKFEGELLYVTVPKIEAYKERGEAQNIATEDSMERKDVGGAHEETANEDEKSLTSQSWSNIDNEKWRIKANWVVNSVMENITERKGLVLTAVLAFSLGVFVSNKLQFSEHW